MPRRNDYLTEREALQIVLEEERARGWAPGRPLSKQRERKEGCDFFSTPPDGGVPHPVEVKGWGESMFLPDGRPRYPQDINEEQRARAERDPNWRLEIVANLEAARGGHGDVERLTVRSSDLAGRLRPWKWRIDLTGLQESVRRGGQPSLTFVGAFASDSGDLSRRASEDEFEPEAWRSS